MLRALTLALLLVPSCAARRAPVDDTWSIEDRDSVRLDVVEALIERQRFDLALQAISELRRAGMSDVQLDLLQAEALSGQELYGEAISLLKSISPKGGEERLKLLGLAYFGQQDIDRSVRAFKRGARQASGPEKASLYNNLGFALAADGRHEDALDAYKRALRADPALGRARNNMGFSLAALGRDEEALEAFVLGAQAEGVVGRAARAEGWYNLGVARQIRGDLPEAMDAWRGALNMKPDHAMALAALQAVETE
jgi:tetratricopeptide (TPR) repeat protein